MNQQKEGKSTLENQTAGLAAGLEQQLDQSTCESQHSISCVQPVFESRSGQRVSSEFNDRGGKRERQSIRFRSCVGDSECNNGHGDSKVE